MVNFSCTSIKSDYILKIYAYFSHSAQIGPTLLSTIINYNLIAIWKLRAIYNFFVACLVGEASQLRYSTFFLEICIYFLQKLWYQIQFFCCRLKLYWISGGIRQMLQAKKRRFIKWRLGWKHWSVIYVSYLRSSNRVAV